MEGVQVFTDLMAIILGFSGDPPGCKDCFPFNYTYSLAEDNYGNVWSISMQGISIFSPEWEKSIVAFRFGTGTSVADFKQDNLDLIKDSEGNIWATNEKGILRFSFKEKCYKERN